MTLTEQIGRVLRGEEIRIEGDKVIELNAALKEIHPEPLLWYYEKATGKTVAYASDYEACRKKWHSVKDKLGCRSSNA